MPTEPDSEADLRARLPAVDRLLDRALVERFGHPRVVAEIRALLEAARAALEISGVAPTLPELQASLAERLAADGVGPVINATGVILHTNLGRAPWSAAAVAAAAAAAGYSSVELERATGRRGRRGQGVVRRLVALSGAEDALAVNNCAAALLLALQTHARGRSVLVSRGELVEIGGGFRIPEILEASGARLVEVGTTNRTHLRDFQAALDPSVACVLRVHHSNFRQIGFVSRPPLRGLAGLGPPLVVDLGSGALDGRAFPGEPTVQEALAGGAGLVCMSGDKLLGGPQAGLVVGHRALVEPMARHPIFRALRLDKVLLAALEATLDDWLCARPLPVQALTARPLGELRVIAEAWRASLPGEIRARVIEVLGVLGGGSLPGRTCPSVALAIGVARVEALRAALLASDPPLLGRIHEGELLLDARTVLPGEVERAGQLLRAALAELPAL